MALGLAPARARRLRIPVLACFAVVALGALAVLAVLEGSRVSVAADPVALARVDVGPFGGTLAHVTATDAEGRPVALRDDGGRLTPTGAVAPGARITIVAVVRRPGWDAWLAGDTSVRRLTVTAPFAHVRSPWITVRRGAPVTVALSEPVARAGAGRRAVAVHGATLTLPAGTPGGAVRVAVAARTWERLGPPVTVHYFPPSRHPVALVSPAPGGRLDPGGELRLTFSQPVGHRLPALDVPGHWRRRDAHTLVFTPAGSGPALGSHVRLTFPRAVAAAGADGTHLTTTRSIAWTVPPASPLRLVQLLAEQGYLPVRFQPSGAPVARTARAQAGAAAHPPAGSFPWRYAATPPELERQFKPEPGNVVVRGAIMMFQDEHHLAVDGLPGPALWKALLAAAVSGAPEHQGYSYVYVHRERRPQLVTLWHDGRTIFTTPGNTGVAAAPTELGTFPVFEHLPETTMTGTNPDGSHYSDPGIKWVSYFNGGDALHAFDRASFGTPQSVGCVELPLAAAARIYRYTPIGTLVTIER